jgi:hypothetical protein
MAYALLSFLTGVTPAQRLKDIAKVITGAATSVTDLEFATQGSSEVVNLEPAGWTLADAGSALEAAGTATRAEYRFSAPCVNPAKTKYAGIGNYTYNSGNINNNGLTTNPKNATGGSMYLYTGSGVAASAVTNPVVGPFSVGDASGGSFYWYPSLVTGGTYQYVISVTNRKIIIVAPTNQNTAVNGIQMVLEFPETSATVLYNNIPVMGYHSFNMRDSSTGTASYGVNYVGGNISANTWVNRIAGFTNWYRKTDNTRTVRFADDCTDFMYCPTLPVAGVDPATSLTQNPLIPILDFRQSYGEGTHDYSSLTDLYFTRTITHLDTVTVGADTYVGLVQNNRYFCVKKA